MEAPSAGAQCPCGRQSGRCEGRHRVVIVGGGFGGLYAALSLRREPVHVTMIDQRNFHLFQPLLYQVATGGLSPANIAAPLRAILSRQDNACVLLAEATGIDAEKRQVILSDGAVSYDTLIVAAGASHHYFGNEHWQPLAPGLKTVEDATEIRRRILLAFEAAERTFDADKRRAWLTFVIVGAGPTGLELAGTLSEIAHDTLKRDFRHINPADAQILLLEGADRVLPPFPSDLSAAAAAALSRLGVTVRTGAMVTDVRLDAVTIRAGEATETISTHTVIWAAGVKASPLGQVLADARRPCAEARRPCAEARRPCAEATGAELDRTGRVLVEGDCSVPGHPDILVIGDLAHHAGADGKPLPAVAPVAMQQGRYVARLIRARLRGKSLPPFRYRDRGMMATIGRAAAVADIKGLRVTGYPAWLAWLFVHLMYLVQFENRQLVFLQWGWSYFTRNRAARLITGESPLPLDL